MSLEPPPATLAQVYDAHFDFVWRNVRRLGVPAASTDDVTQDVFVVVLRRIADFDGRATMKAWLFGIIVRVVRNHRRTFQRKGARNVSLEHEGSDRGTLADGLSRTNDVAEHIERVRSVEAALQQLDEDKRTLLILSELEEWTLRELAQRLGSNTSTVHTRVRAAKRAFEKAYRESAGEEDSARAAPARE